MPRSLEPHLFVIIGASGDLTTRKLIPALHHLMRRHDALKRGHILGVARSGLTDDDFRHDVRNALAENSVPTAQLDAWCDSHIFYQSLGPAGDDYGGLRRRVETIEAENRLPGNRVFYLALPPKAFPPTIEALGRADLHESDGWTRVVIEKPFGQDLDSARSLNALVHKYFDESEVYRIDHYLGKETVQNLLVFRFANAMFESVWHRGQIEQVEIRVHERLGVETRAGYYDESGALRDMVQNHLTQVLSLIAMEAPSRFDATAIRSEKVKLLESVMPIRPEHVVFGQYAAGTLDGEEVLAYRDEQGVAADSNTETYVRLRLNIANWRWSGVPFLLEAGKRMADKRTSILIRFQPAPISIFHPFEATCEVHPNVLEMTLQPNEGFDLHFEVKQPRMPVRLDTQTLQFRYDEVFGDLPDAYETLLLDVLQGDQTLFVHADEVIASWRLYSPLLKAGLPLRMYTPGSGGPAAERAEAAASTGQVQG